MACLRSFSNACRTDGRSCMITRRQSELMRIVTLLLIAMMPASMLSSRPKSLPVNGSVCVAAVEPPNEREKSLANPAGGNRVQHYSIRIDDLPLVQTARDKGFRSPPLEY